MRTYIGTHPPFPLRKFVLYVGGRVRMYVSMSARRGGGYVCICTRGVRVRTYVSMLVREYVTNYVR